MNARKHRKSEQATRDCLRLGPKWYAVWSEPSELARREHSLPVYRANLNHPVKFAGHGNAANSARLATGQTFRKACQGARHWEDRRSQRQQVMRWICPRQSGQSLQESLQNHRERKKANDG